MIGLTGLFDAYGRNAWLRPALIVSLTNYRLSGNRLYHPPAGGGQI